MERLGSITFKGGCPGAKLVCPPRVGLRHLAYPSGGPVDQEAFRAANWLVGNDADAPVFELPLKGGRWQFDGPITIAFTGADMAWSVDGQRVPRYTTITTNDIGELAGGFSTAGSYGYLAVAGLDFLKSDFSEVFNHCTLQSAASWRCNKSTKVPQLTVEIPAIPDRADCLLLETRRGPEWDWLGAADQATLLSTVFKLSPVSNRQGLRLIGSDGGTSSYRNIPSMISSPVLPGTVQLTPSGPIILGPDAQTVGGYPRILILGDRQLATSYQVPLGAHLRFNLAE